MLRRSCTLLPGRRQSKSLSFVKLHPVLLDGNALKEAYFKLAKKLQLPVKSSLLTELSCPEIRLHCLRWLRFWSLLGHSSQTTALHHSLSLERSDLPARFPVLHHLGNGCLVPGVRLGEVPSGKDVVGKCIIHASRPGEDPGDVKFRLKESGRHSRISNHALR